MHTYRTIRRVRRTVRTSVIEVRYDGRLCGARNSTTLDCRTCLSRQSPRALGHECRSRPTKRPIRTDYNCKRLLVAGPSSLRAQCQPACTRAGFSLAHGCLLPPLLASERTDTRKPRASDAPPTPSPGNLAAVFLAPSLSLSLSPPPRPSRSLPYAGRTCSNLVPRFDAPIGKLPCQTEFSPYPDSGPFRVHLRRLHLHRRADTLDLSDSTIHFGDE